MRFDRRILFTGLSLGTFALSLALLIHTQARLNYARAELLRATTPELPVQEALPLSVHDETPAVSPEILRLRAEVTRLSRRKQELEAGQGAAFAVGEGAGAMVASNAAVPVPPGFIRTTAAQDRGFASPEATMETLLWAVQHQDANRLLECFTTKGDEHIRSQLTTPQGAEEFFKRGAMLPGFALRARKVESETSVEVGLEILPGAPLVPVKLELENGAWRISAPF